MVRCPKMNRSLLCGDRWRVTVISGKVTKGLPECGKLHDEPRRERRRKNRSTIRWQDVHHATENRGEATVFFTNPDGNVVES